MKRACENAKIILSKDNDTKIILQEYLPSINIDFSLTREEFECFCESLFKKFEKIIDEFLKDNNVNKEDISEVIPIGGSTLIPRIKGIIRSKFKDSKINDTLNPHEVVAIGAGIQGGLLSGLENLTSYNLLDITNYSLGVEIVGEKMSKIIKKYTHIPIQYYSSYHNEYDYPEFLSIKVYEGEDENNIKNDIFLGEFKIGNLPRKKAKEINITVVFDIDKNSILNVKAIEEANKDNVEEKYINLKKNNEPNDLNKEFVVEEQKGLMEIINKLRDKENSLEYVEIKPYSMILKDFIIEEENEIYKLKERKEKNKELIKQKNKLILEKLKIFINGFINEQLTNGKIKNYEKKLFLSYIKYYFNKINKYFTKYKNDVSDSFMDFRRNIVKNIKEKILEEIQFYDPRIIFEIIEDFTNNKEIFEEFIVFIITNLYGKLSEELININFETIQMNKLLELKRKTKNILSLIEKLKQIPTEIKFVPNYLDSVKLKIKAKEFLIKGEGNIDKNELVIFIEEYKKSNDVNSDILDKLYRLCNPNCAKIRDNNNNFFISTKDQRENEENLYHLIDRLQTYDKRNEINRFNYNLAIEWKNIICCSPNSREEKKSLLNKALSFYENSFENLKQNSNNNNLIKEYERIIRLINIIKDGLN